MACLVTGLAAGVILSMAARPTPVRGDGHQAAPAAGAKAPIEEVLRCPLAFAGVHLLKDLPEQSAVAYHYCVPLNDNLSQCLLYDGTGPNARMIGVEYLITDAVYQAMPAEEKAYWHDHKHEVDSGLLRCLTQRGDEEARTLAKIRPLWGKVYQTWASGRNYPYGPARLYWSVAGKEPYVLPDDARLPAELREGAYRQWK
jgi:hypothetical protein